MLGNSIIFRVDLNGPARREDGMMGVEIVGFEEVSTKNRTDRDGLAIGQINHRRRHAEGGVSLHPRLLIATKSSSMS